MQLDGLCDELKRLLEWLEGRQQSQGSQQSDGSAAWSRRASALTDEQCKNLGALLRAA